MEGIETLLSGVPLFEGMGPAELELLAGCAKNVRFEAGDVIFREGGPADVFYVIRHGTVAIEAYAPPRGAMVIETVGAGGVIGWSWLFPPYRWNFDARSLSQVRATAFDGACLRGKCEDDAAFGYELMKRFTQVMTERLQWTRLRLLDIYGRDGL